MFRTHSAARLAAATLVVAAAAALAVPPAAQAAPVRRMAVPYFSSGNAIAPSSPACRIGVKSVNLAADRMADATPVFAQAMDRALRTHPRCYAHGPSGAPQAVVYVPPGVYRLANLWFPSNVRLEVSAAATLQTVADRGTHKTVSLIQWTTKGNKPAPPVTNVSLVGVGTASSIAKWYVNRLGGATIWPFAVTHNFTMNLNPARIGSTNYNPGVNLMNVRYFRIENVFSIQNSTNQVNAGHKVAWPTSARAVLQLHSSRASVVGGPYVRPTFGVIRNHVNYGGPRGYGPNQINSAANLSMANIYTFGGTALRVETDDSLSSDGTPMKGARVDNLRAWNIVGARCNRAVSLSPHGQRNGYVAVSGVYAYSCNQAVVAQADTKLAPSQRGSFYKPVVAGVRVHGGPFAQLDDNGHLWRVGWSKNPYYVDPAVNWAPRIYVWNKTGAFTRP